VALASRATMCSLKEKMSGHVQLEEKIQNNNNQLGLGPGQQKTPKLMPVCQCPSFFFVSGVPPLVFFFYLPDVNFPFYFCATEVFCESVAILCVVYLFSPHTNPVGRLLLLIVLVVFPGCHPSPPTQGVAFRHFQQSI